MSYNFFIEREVFFNFNKKQRLANVSEISLFSLGLFKFFDFNKIKFSKPCLSKNFIGFSGFPFLVLSNGSLVFYNSGYNNFLSDFKSNQTGLLLFDDLYSFKNKVIF